MLAIRAQRAFTRPKEEGRACEDVILGCRARGCYAVSDGASVSYDSRGWARALCRQFVADARPGVDWLYQARDRFAARSAPAADDWAAAHAADRGSFATFLGIAISESRIVVHAIGDTALFVIATDGAIRMIPELAGEDFRRDPVLLCSHPWRGAFDDTDAAFAAAEITLDAPPDGWAGTRLLAMTDALAEFVANAADAAGQLARLEEMARPQNGESFCQWAGEAIAAGRIRHDDCALLTLLL